MTDTLKLLNGLIETCKDGELGYRTAAEHVRNTELESILSHYSTQRARFAKQLEAEVKRLGGQPADSGTLAATLFRGWIDLKAALTGGDAGAIIAACETGEESAVGAFQIATDSDITGVIRTIVEKQGEQIQAAHVHILRLKAETVGSHFQKNE